MKNFKKLLALLLAVLMTVSLLAACGVETSTTKDEEKKEKKLSPEEQVEEVVTAYVEAIIDFDGEEAAEYVSEDSDHYDEVLELSRDALIDSFVSGAGMSSAGDAAEVFMEFIEDVLGSITYEIGDIDVDDDTATVEITLTTPDFDAVGERFSNPSELFTEDELSDLYAEMIEMQTNGETEDAVLVKVVERMIEKVDIDDLDTTEEESVITLEKDGKDWIIISNE